MVGGKLQRSSQSSVCPARSLVLLSEYTYLETDGGYREAASEGESFWSSPKPSLPHHWLWLLEMKGTTSTLKPGYTCLWVWPHSDLCPTAHLAPANPNSSPCLWTISIHSDLSPPSWNMGKWKIKQYYCWMQLWFQVMSHIIFNSGKSN